MDSKKNISIKERVLYVAEYKGIAKEKFLQSIGMTYGSFRGNAKKTSLNSDALANIYINYPDVSMDWLIAGEGEMIKRSENQQEKSSKGVFDGVMYGGDLTPVNKQPSKETETDMTDKEIIEMQRGYIEALKFKVEALSRENQALSEQIKSWRTQDQAIKNM